MQRDKTSRISEREHLAVGAAALRCCLCRALLAVCVALSLLSPRTKQ